MGRRIIFSFFTFVIFTLSISCESIRGIAQPGENYNTRYNLPGEPIVPYTNPGIMQQEEQIRINACDLVRTREGLKCI